MEYIIAFTVSFLIVVLLMPIFIKSSFEYGFTDKPTKRKKHSKETPLIGGVVMFIGFFASYFIFNDFFDQKGITIFVSAFLILIIGFIIYAVSDVDQKARVKQRIIQTLFGVVGIILSLSMVNLIIELFS